MGKTTGFLEYSRQTHPYKEVEKRKKNFNEFVVSLKKDELQKQGARCMDCGIPFCQSGCPLGNIIPDFNDLVYQGDMESAFATLFSTNNFPDITGRVCPAPCESACVLGINKPPVAIKTIEYSIAEKAFKNNWFPTKTLKKTNKKIAIIGSGPAGLACADQLAYAGHEVVVYEREDELGGLLTYGIPNFKLEKEVVFRHISRLKKQGVSFLKNVEVGKDISVKELEKRFDAIVLAIGSTVPRDLPLAHRHGENIHFAMDFLSQNTKRVLKKNITEPLIDAKGKEVLVIGGGDTGSDCIGTSIRQGANKVTQIEILPRPPKERDATMPWPQYDRIFRVSSSQEEGCVRKFSIATKDFVLNTKGEVKGIDYTKVEWNPNQKKFIPLKEQGFLKADLIFLAMGFLHAEPKLLKKFKIKTDPRGNVFTEKDKYQTNIPKIFTAGDARRGQSLVVWAISEGRECALAVDEFLTKKKSVLASKAF